MTKASHCRHSCLVFYWAMFVFLVHKYMYFFFPDLFPQVAVIKGILLSVDAFIHIKADTESEVAKAAIKLRNTFIAAETVIGRGLYFGFYFFYFTLFFFGVKAKRF